MALGKKALIKSNLELWLNDLFIRNGLYVNVASGDLDIYSRNLSSLVASSDPTFAVDNTVFQSAFKNWVHEDSVVGAASGVAAPVVNSGVIVDGTFYSTTTTSGTYAHIVDFPNGRVIFDTALAGSPVVEADFSYKEVTVDFANRLNNENNPIRIETSLKDNPAQTGVESYPTSDTRTLPAIFIDVLNRKSSAYELGTRDAVADYFGVFHIWARDDFQRDMIEDILADEHRQVLMGIDFRTAQYPLLSRGEKNPAFTSYTALANVHSPQFWRRIYLESIEPKKDAPLFEVERSRILFNARVYPNF